MTTAIETAVTEYLEAKKITYKAHCRGETTRDQWRCDEWIIDFERLSADKRRYERLTQSYYTGLGHRKLTKYGMMEVRNNPRLTPGRMARLKEQHSFPVKPEPASVLHCLLLDSEGAQSNFNDWCSDYGYDNDNDSRKALQIYTDCMEIRDKMLAFFTREELAELRTLVEDY